MLSFMRPILRERHSPAIDLAGVAIVVPFGLVFAFGHHMVMFGTNMHFIGVGISALVAALAALALTVVGVRRKDGRAVLVGTGFTVMAGLLAIHGLATPGAIIGMNGVIALTGAATLPVGAAILALSAIPALRRPRRIELLVAFQVMSLLLVLGLGILGMADPDIVPAVPEYGSPPAVAMLIAGVALYVLLALRATKTYLLTRRAADLAVVVGIAWLTAALPGALLMDYMDLGWWLGHLYELGGLAILGGVVAADLHRAAESRPLVGDLKAAELVAREEAFLDSRVHALLQRLADKDESTEEHTRRVAMRAVQVGEQMGLAPGRLRSLAIGGLLHDMGKLSVPERILKKPGKLESHEFDVIKRHPGWGNKLLRELGGFSPAVHELVHSHHERLDGKGYPRGLGESELSLDTRILTVCDVYDALVSPRVYRDAWRHEQAMALLHEDTGKAFDERCVAALERVLARDTHTEPHAVPLLRVATA